ncbi:U3 small nucleolar RNA-associated protein 14 homolog A isoform X5 [Motacilla alba alba]|uniref:U3 small nucleolar RNA-associated protein 14 homolog A isoform X5 n=1 Tax=Motacilla alba alba TaxID=1094192 RepID=UPI0018D552A0|nr:U3 small nucleolar RNA-associated protein 14 homolog A isoform X5 [Motacilla alba alba]
MAERDPAAAAAGSGSESDEGEDGERRHRQLLEAISALSGRKRRKLAERSEASGQVSEFNVTCKGAGEKLVLSELLQPVHPKSTLGSVRKELARVKRKAAVELPLSKEEAKRVVREAAYVSTSKDVGKWQQVVLQNRRAEQLVFPLRQDIATVTPLERVTSAWKARTPLEQEIFGLLHKTQQPVTDPLLTPEEMASVQAMSLEEARRRRAELQKARAVQSYYEAKARRAKRIKSKKYHRVLKKSRRRQALKEFEQLHKSDPAAALARLEELEQLRMQERMSLKHQNKGKWARSRAIMAKYDLEARKAMQEQLARNKELMQKVRVEPPEEELCEVPEEDTTALPMPSGANPWMLGKPSGLAPEPEAQEGPRDDPVPGAVENKDEMEEEEEELSEEEALLQDFEQKRRERTGSPERHGRDHGAGETETGAVELGDSPAPPVYAEELGDSPAPPVCAEELGDSPAPPVCAEELVSAGPEPPPQAQEQLLLSEQLRRVQTMEEVESLAKEELVEEQEKLVALRAGKRAQQQEEGRAGDRHTKKAPAKRKMISLEAVLDGKPQEMDCPSLPVVLEEEEGGIEQRGMITEAFAGDDVVADFRREKRKAEEAGKPQVVNLVLPGWGEWGGTGLKPSARKVKRFLIKPPPAPPRKDQHMPHVIMSEKRNIHAAAHQVSELPFPFERHQQFEQSMRTPVGATWNTQRAFQKLTAPRVITRTGHIIQPISAEDVPDTAPGSGARLGGEAMPARKAVPGKKAVSRGKAVPGKKAVSRGKAVPGKKAVSMGKAVPGDKAVSRGKVVPGKKAVPGEKAVSRGKAVPGEKAVSRGKAVPGEKAQPQHCRAR